MGPALRERVEAMGWRRIAFVVVTAWLLAAVLVVFFHGLGPATQSGSVEQQGARYQQYLGRGWYPLEVDPFTPTASDPAHWIAVNFSAGPTSTIDPAPSWRRLTLRLAAIPCANGAAQTIQVRQGSTALRRLAPSAAWASYAIMLAHPDRPVTLHYSCVISQQAPGRGLQNARHLAVLLGGVSGSG